MPLIRAYDKAIMPCRDRSEWTKTNGPDVLPPFYEKKVGRPKRCRRKNPEENEADTRISKHGVKMHCSYCRSPDHTKRNCPTYKADLDAGIAFPTTDDLPTEEVAAATEEVTSTTEGLAATSKEIADDHVQDDQVPADHVPHKRKRKPSVKKMDQQEAEALYEARRKRAKVFDENGDIDVPEILQNIVPKNLVLGHDPTQLKSTMVYNLSHEIPTRPIRRAEPLPEESSFVAEHRAEIPISGRTSTAQSAWNVTRAREGSAIERGRGRSTTTRGRGRGRSTTGRGRGSGRARQSGNIRKKRGAKWVLFGDGGQSSSQPQQLFQEEYQTVEINTTQGAPTEYSD